MKKIFLLSILGINLLFANAGIDKFILGGEREFSCNTLKEYQKEYENLVYKENFKRCALMFQSEEQDIHKSYYELSGIVLEFDYDNTLQLIQVDGVWTQYFLKFKGISKPENRKELLKKMPWLRTMKVDGGGYTSTFKNEEIRVEIISTDKITLKSKKPSIKIEKCGNFFHSNINSESKFSYDIMDKCLNLNKKSLVEYLDMQDDFEINTRVLLPIYYNGIYGIKKDWKKAMQYLNKEPSEKQYDSMKAYMYSQGGYGVKKDLKKAKKYTISAIAEVASSNLFSCKEGYELFYNILQEEGVFINTKNFRKKFPENFEKKFDDWAECNPNSYYIENNKLLFKQSTPD